MLLSLKNRKTVAPDITGMLNRFEYLMVKFLLKPKARRAIMLAPARLIPGTNEKHCIIPVKNANEKLKVS